jgi:hypothetical protein
VRRNALDRVKDIIQKATQARDGRVEVERGVRDEVRRIAVPLRLGDMGETHFVLRDEWSSRFLRKKAGEGVTSITVRRLRARMDQPEAMGLRTDMQNLVILSFALQNDLSFYLHGRWSPSSNVWMMTRSRASRRCRAAHHGRMRASAPGQYWV